MGAIELGILRLTGWCVFICYSLGGWVLVYLTIYGWVGLRWYFFHRVTHYFFSNVMSHSKKLKNKYSNLLNIFYFCIILPLLLMHSSEIRGLWLKKLTQWSVSKFAIFLTQSNNAKFDPELANVRVHSFNTILWLLPAQPNFHRLKSSTILVRWQFIYKPYTKSKQTMEMPTVTAV